LALFGFDELVSWPRNSQHKSIVIPGNPGEGRGRPGIQEFQNHLHTGFRRYDVDVQFAISWSRGAVKKPGALSPARAKPRSKRVTVPGIFGGASIDPNKTLY
jgi:hypothetical protein